MNFYVQTLSALLRQPRRFFGELHGAAGFVRSLGFLAISAVFFSAASLLQQQASRSLLMGTIHLFNAIGMVFILSGLAYGIMAVFIGKKVSYKTLFGVYALASGVTLLISWVPYLSVLTEPWKWWLIGTGMMKGCGMKLGESFIIIAVSLCIWIIIFLAIMPAIAP